MLKKIFSGLCLLVLMLFPLTAMGQKSMPHGKWWYSENIVKKLDLTKGEINLLDNIYTQSRRKLIELKSEVEKERFEYETLMESEDMKESEVMSQAKKLETVRAKLSTERSRFLLEVRKVLGAERFRKLKSSFKEMRNPKTKGKVKRNRN